MGVAGCGKSTLAQALSASLVVPFLEGDKLHPRANVEKMAAGVPLDDGDRWPWLAAVRMAMRDEPEVVVTCSALRRSYRDALRAAGDVRFLYLAASREEITCRLAARKHHYMHVNMVASQFETLEPPAAAPRTRPMSRAFPRATIRRICSPRRSAHWRRSVPAPPWRRCSGTVPSTG